jgi:hypothetical protein
MHPEQIAKVREIGPPLSFLIGHIYFLLLGKIILRPSLLGPDRIHFL